MSIYIILRNNNLIFYKNIDNNKKYFRKLKIFIIIASNHIKKINSNNIAFLSFI